MTRLRTFHHFDEIYEKHKKKHNIKILEQLIGLLIFIILFVLLIPYLLYKIKLYTVLEVYLPNLDLIANLLSFNEGPFNIWKELYVNTPINLYSLCSQIFINYLALIGVSYIFLRETKITKNIYSGLSLAMIMILITYLVPSPLICYLMEKCELYFKTFKNNKFLTKELINIYVLIIGLILTLSVILFEKMIIKYFRNHLINILSFLIK